NGADGLLIARVVGATASASSNVIGGTGSGDGNVISGNNAFGIDIFLDAHDNLVAGNFIGTNIDGSVAIPNQFSGVTIGDSAGNVVGVTPADRVADLGPGLGNVISGNAVHGVLVVCAGSVDNVVAGNIIGLNEAGTEPLGNKSNGILVTNSTPDCAGVPS